MNWENIGSYGLTTIVIGSSGWLVDLDRVYTVVMQEVRGS